MLNVQLLGGLGVIPSWQFETDPALNPNINPHVQFPEGMNQLTVQPTLPDYRTSGDSNLQGLGIHVSAQAPRPAGIFRPRGASQFSLGMPSISKLPRPVGLHGIFDTTWWQSRKWLAFGLIGALGVGAAALATKVLR